MTRSDASPTSPVSTPDEGPMLIPPQLRTRRACRRCRTHKTKCDGKYPCRGCKERGVLCLPGQARRKKSREQSLGVADEASSAISPPLPLKGEQINNLLHEVHCSISGSDISTSTQQNLFYGPSSSFAFLQQLHLFLWERNNVQEVVANENQAHYSAEALSEFGYRSVFFGTHSMSTTELQSTTPAHSLKQPPNFKYLLKPDDLPLSLANLFLDMYLSTTHHVLPFCSAPALEALVVNMYSTSTRPIYETPDTILLYAVLAIGATLTDQSAWAESLYISAETKLGSWGDAVNIRSVQISMLLSEFLHYCGRPNAAHLTLGTAVLKALAVGLHRNTSAARAGANPSYANQLRERRATFWSLYGQDRKLSLSLGRPANINDLDVRISEPDENDGPLVDIVALAKISHKVYYSIYGAHRGSLGDFCEKVQEIREEILLFHTTLGPECYFPLPESGNPTPNAELTTLQLVVAFDVLQCMIIALRPCLVLRALQRKSKAPNPTDSNMNLWIENTSIACSAAAAHVINIFSQTLASNRIVKYMRHSRFFIEGACFIILFDIIRDPTRPSEQNFESIAEGLRCFAQLPADNLLQISINGVTRILEATKGFVQRTKGCNGDDSPVQEQTENNYEQQSTFGVSTSFDNVGLPEAPATTEQHRHHCPLETSSGTTCGTTSEMDHFGNGFNTFDDTLDMTDGELWQNTDFFDLGYNVWMDDTANNDFSWN